MLYVLVAAAIMLVRLCYIKTQTAGAGLVIVLIGLRSISCGHGGRGGPLKPAARIA